MWDGLASSQQRLLKLLAERPLVILRAGGGASAHRALANRGGQGRHGPGALRPDPEGGGRPGGRPPDRWPSGCAATTIDPLRAARMSAVELHIFTEPQQGASQEQLRTVAVAAERLGFAGFFRSDHPMAIGAPPRPPGPTESWAILADVAVATRSIRIGTLMTSATFRVPGPLAVAVAQVDQVSGGRVDFGFGAGWYQAEHDANGIPFPEVGERMERFAEQLEIVRGIWSTKAGGSFSHQGPHYGLRDCPRCRGPSRPGAHRS